ncbi:hypothetical protein Ato02nite_026330 [Paractinoplanes toevensis]|uniref:Uncharacterized protein n=1 Tax=Paractinoplanes toevensis TaxID=571911 RepID=A0A919T893_9ACTN|nr:hypothetical protein Ato02nite_026330 [Actinoplanes toevensis]
MRAEAISAPGYSGGLGDVYRRARRRRNRQVAGAFAAVLALAGAGFLLRPETRHVAVVPPVAPSVSAPAVVPAQRLLMLDGPGIYHVTGGPQVQLGASEFGELTVSRGFAIHRVTGADSWDRYVGLRDGRIVALGPHGPTPGTDVTGPDINLVVTRADGRIEVKRNVRHPGESVALVAADSTSAYLWRPAGLVQHDLGSGSEHVLVERDRLGVPSTLDGAADLVGRRFVVSLASAPCSLRWLFDEGTTVTMPLRGVPCAHVNGLRLSPDATRIAVAYRTTDLTVGLAVLRLSDGAVLADRKFARPPSGKSSMPVGLAWQDDSTLLAAILPVGTGGTQKVNLLTVAVSP